MTAPNSSDRFGTVPAATVIAACLQAQADIPARSGFARTFGRTPLSADSRPWYLGALGELRVAALLARLGPDWTVLHSVPIGERGSDIDHVVVGPAGVFTINTKFHEDARVWVGSRRLMVNGQKTDYLRNSRYETQRVSRLLSMAIAESVDVHAVIVLVGARSITIREQPTDVAVLRDNELVRWLKRRPVTLNDDDRNRVASTLSRRETWSGAPVPAPEIDEPAFAHLRREVIAARRVRLAWATATLAGFITVVGAFAIDAYATLLGG